MSIKAMREHREQAPLLPYSEAQEDFLEEPTPPSEKEGSAQKGWA